MNSKCRTGNRNNLLVLSGLAIICLGLSQAVRSRNASDNTGRGQPSTQSAVFYSDCIGQHSIGQLVVKSDFAPVFSHWSGPDELACHTGEEVVEPGSIYPKGSNIAYLWQGHWSIGAVVGEDTLVSTPGEFYASQLLYPSIEYRSSLDPTAPEYEGAVSEEDHITRAFDTIPWDAPYRPEPDFFGMRRHIPLGIEITNRSYAWSYGYAEDFVLYDFGFKNIGENLLSNVYLSLTVLGQAGDDGFHEFYGNLGGLLKTFSSPLECGLVDTLNMIWMADNDGDPTNGEFQHIMIPRSATAVTGVRVLSTPTTVFGDEPDMSYNWWTYGQFVADFGPRRRENFRDFRTNGLGNPKGDANMYYLMRNGEIDYDPAFIATIRNLDYIWLYPDQEVALNIADGYEVMRHVLSFGPFVIPPGATLPVAFAYVAGEDFHTDPDNLANLPYNPTEYYKNLDFSDLVLNSMYASWIYDNPGVDTDGDGVAGKFTICAFDSIQTDSGWIVIAADTVYYAGDGVPDWRAAGPPPAPKVWLEPIVNGVRVRFNGMRSETEKDVFTRLVDFEGYRVYFGRDERISSYAIVASYDREDFDKFIWVPHYAHGGNYRLRDAPFTFDSLRCLYGAGRDPCQDEDFNPLFYTIINPYVHPRFPDSIFYFAKHDHNVSHLGLTTPIRKVYPNEPDPSGQEQATLLPDQFTGDGYLKFYEYELIIEDLLPSVSYWINVTAFDFGSPESRLAGLETSITLNAQMIYPWDNESAATVATDEKMSVYVYPNPYRIDAGYRTRGFEGRTRANLNEEKVRAIHFAHLPPKCTISIFSIDGDLVDRIDHDMNPDDPNSSHARWDLISRNREPVVSGLYFWTVETPNGRTQLGRLSIVM